MTTAVHNVLRAGKKLEGKVAVLTASTSGIAYSIAKKMVLDGAKVMLSSRKSDNVEQAVRQLREECEGASVEGVVCHVGKDEHRKNLMKETMARFGRLDILVNNAAVNPATNGTLATPESVWDKIFDVNVKSAALLVKEAHPHLTASGAGSVMFISSGGAYVAFPKIGAYMSSKTALLGLTKVLADELARDNIRVNCIAPGMIRTKFGEVLWSNPALLAERTSVLPSWRVGEPDECAGIVSYLCSDEGSFVTGENIPLIGVEQCRM